MEFGGRFAERCRHLRARVYRVDGAIFSFWLYNTIPNSGSVFSCPEGLLVREGLVRATRSRLYLPMNCLQERLGLLYPVRPGISSRKRLLLTVTLTYTPRSVIYPTSEAQPPGLRAIANPGSVQTLNLISAISEFEA